MKNQRPLWMSEEGPGELDSLQRLVMNQEWKAIAAELSDGDTIPKDVLDGVAALAVAVDLAERGLHLQPDDAYWYVEEFRARKPPKARPADEAQAGQVVDLMESLREALSR